MASTLGKGEQKPMHVFGVKPFSEAGLIRELLILALEGQNKAKFHHVKLS